MSSALIDSLLTGGAPAPGGAPGGDAPPAIPDPQPHLQPGPPEGGAEAEAGADPAAGAPEDPQSAEVETLKSLLGLTSSYLSLPTVEPDEALKVKKIEMLVHELLAGNQKMQDSLTGANPAMRKALGPSGG